MNITQPVLYEALLPGFKQAFAKWKHSTPEAAALPEGSDIDLFVTFLELIGVKEVTNRAGQEAIRNLLA